MDIEISGKNIMLHPMTQKEHRALWRKYSPDPAVDQRPYEYNEEKADLLYEALAEKADWCPTAGIFTRNGEVIGMAQLPRVVYSENRTDVYIMLANENCRDKGYGTEALRLLVRFARENHGINKFYAETAASNARMRAVLEANGFMNMRVRGETLDYVLRL